MSKNNISVFVWLNQTKLNKKGLAPLSIRITFNRERKTISTGYSLAPDKWDAAKSRAKVLLKQRNK